MKLSDILREFADKQVAVSVPYILKQIKKAADLLDQQAARIAEYEKADCQNPKQSMSLNDALEAASKNIEKAPRWLKRINERNNKIDQQRFGIQADEQKNEAKVNDDN